MDNPDYFKSQEGCSFGVTEEDDGYVIFDTTSAPKFIDKASLIGKMEECIRKKGDKYVSKNKVNSIYLDTSGVCSPKLKVDSLKKRFGKNYLIESL